MNALADPHQLAARQIELAVAITAADGMDFSKALDKVQKHFDALAPRLAGFETLTGAEITDEEREVLFAFAKLRMARGENPMIDHDEIESLIGRPITLECGNSESEGICLAISQMPDAAPDETACDTQSPQK